MKRIAIPNTDLEVSVLCYGVAGFGTSATGDKADRLAAAFLEAGGNFVDTAHCYAFWLENGLGQSETEIGNSLRRLGVADSVVLATKGGHPDGGPDYPRPEEFLSELTIRSDIEESLNRLQQEVIALYYLHRDDGKTPVGEIIEMLNGFIRHGRVRYIGASNWSVERLAAANAYATENGLYGFVASQIQGSLAEPNWKPEGDPTTRFITDEERAWHRQSGVPIVAYSATAGGYFAGRGHDKGGYASPANAARYERAVQLAKEQNVTPAQIAIAYLNDASPRILPLFGTEDLAHLKEITDAADLELTAEQRNWLRNG